MNTIKAKTMDRDEINIFLNALPEAVLLVDDKGVIKIANAKATHLLNRNKIGLEGYALNNLTSLSENEVLDRLKTSKRSRQPLHIAIPFIDPNGHTLQLTTTGFLFSPAKENCNAKIMLRLKRENKSSSQFISLNKEIKQQHKAMRLLLNSQEQLHKTTEKLNDYIDIVDKYVISSSTDKTGNIIRVSEAFCNISQYSREELIGEPHNIVRHPDMQKNIFKDLWSSIKSGNSWYGELKNLAKDGTAYYLDVNIEPDFDKNDNIIGYTAIRLDITDKKRIEELSQQDPLTKISNRLKLDAVASKEIERSLRYQSDLSIILLDIDHFKHVNDTYGHLVGDKTLIELSKVLIERTRNTDIVGRWGGEEFLIVCPETNLDKALILAEDLRQSISEHIFPVIKHCTCSFGVSTFIDKDNYETLLKTADEALYKAKASGRNQVRT